MDVGQHTMLVYGSVLIGVRPLGSGKPATPVLHDIQAVMVGNHMRQIRVQRTSGDVIDDLRSPIQSRCGHGRAGGVDGQHRTGRNQRVDGTGDAGQFILLRHSLGTGTRGFGADVDDVSAGGHHIATMLCGLGRVQPQAAVRGRVLGDIEHAHHHGVRCVVQCLQISHCIPFLLLLVGAAQPWAD